MAISKPPPCAKNRLSVMTSMGPAVLQALLHKDIAHLEPPQVESSLETMQYGSNKIIDAAVKAFYQLSLVTVLPHFDNQEKIHT